jgi:hypothetical protein
MFIACLIKNSEPYRGGMLLCCRPLTPARLFFRMPLQTEFSQRDERLGYKHPTPNGVQTSLAEVELARHSTSLRLG